MKTIKQTTSLCPQCLKKLSATIYEEKGRVFIKKECAEHGVFEDLYWSSYEAYVRAQRFAVVGQGVETPCTEIAHGHPFDCGLCPNHKSHTTLAIIDVTNRCNLQCPICFANAAVAGYIYEPSRDQIEGMLKRLRSMKPVPVNAIQFSGGEPTIREDLPELVKIAKDVGFDHVEVNTNGIRLANSVDYCRTLDEAGVSTVYLQFDGVKPETYIISRGQDLLETKFKAIENCRRSGLDSIVLVPTVVKGVNDDQLGDIIRFAVQNFDVVRAVNFQPVSITGRIDYEKRKEMRITIPDCERLIAEQTQGQVKPSDFYPIPVVVPFSRAMNSLTGKNYVEFTVHEHCGAATFLFVEDEKFVPITRHIDVEGFMNAMDKIHENAAKGAKLKARLQMATASLRYSSFKLLRELMGGVLKEGSYASLSRLMSRIMMVGMMHFQDLYNLDLERLERCGIHYAIPDGRLIPFCAMNSIYRADVERALGKPLRAE